MVMVTMDMIYKGSMVVEDQRLEWRGRCTLDFWAPWHCHSVPCMVRPVRDPSAQSKDGARNMLEFQDMVCMKSA